MSADADYKVVRPGIELRRRANRRVIAILALFLLLIGGMVAFNVRSTRAERDSALIVDATERQTALTQRYASEVILKAGGYTADPAETRTLLEDSAKALLEGGSVLTPRPGSKDTVRVSKPGDWRLRRKLEQEVKLIGELTAAGDRLLAGGSATARNEAGVLELRLAAAKLETVTNDAAFQLSTDARKSLLRLERVEIVLGVLSAICALGMAVLLMRTAERQSRRFRSLVNNIWDVIIILNPDGRIRYLTPSFERVFGYRPGEKFGSRLLELVHEDDLDRVRQQLDQLATTPMSSVTIEARMRTRDGSWRVIEGATTNLVHDRSVEGYVLNARDVTDARAAAEELARSNDLLAVASQHKTDFLANMSHELRTPLNAIIGYTEMLTEEAADLGADQFLPDLEKIGGAGRHLLTLINNILDLSKIEAGKVDLYLETFDVADALHDVVHTIRPLVEKNGNTLVVDPTDDLGNMRADLTKLRQTLFNLLSNASKFTEHGTITLSASRPAEAADVIRIAVTDTGIGMSPDQVARLFQEFTQADESTTRRYGGTGLGLTISKRFCELMGGDIAVVSATGVGSTFTITLPISVDGRPAEPVPALADGASLPADAPTVLVIDDDPQTLDLLNRFLTREGYRVVTAKGGEDGLRLARECHPAAITLDVLMPEVDGWSVLTQLKADPELADVPVIMISIVDDRNLGFVLGANDYLTKPIQRDLLLAALDRYRPERRADVSVLIVEDEGETREMLRRILEGEGWSVVEAANGKVGLDLIESHLPDVILLDLMMPEMDGFEFVHELRLRREWAKVPVIVVTAKDLDESDRRRLSQNVETILLKGSYSRDELLERVRDRVREAAGTSD